MDASLPDDPLVAGTCDIQKLSKTYEVVARSKTELWHRILTHYLPLYFPEADRFHRSFRGDWLLAFPEAFPSPHMITAMDKDAFIEAVWPVIGRRVGKAALLADIYETSKTSVGLPVAPDSDAIRMFRLVLAQGRSLVQQRNAIEDRAAELLANHPDYQLLRTIPGIGPVNALVVMAAPGRGGQHAERILQGFGGILQVDGYSGYNRLIAADRIGPGIQLAHCWAHARRKLIEITRTGPAPIAEEGVALIRDLYAIAAEIHGSDPTTRLAVRQDRSAAILARLDDWLAHLRARASAKSPLGEALAYIAKYRDGLGRFLADGRVEIDNNASSQLGADRRRRSHNSDAPAQPLT